MTVVKKLEWNEYNDEQGIPDRWDAEASSFGVFYSIEIQHDGYRVVFDHEAVGAVGVFDTLEAAKAAAQADYEARVMSAIEPVVPVSRPSAARELALDVEFATIRAMIYCYEGDSAQAFEAQKALANIWNAIRALSSPYHADTGKVEGDGWKPIESAPKDGTPVLIAWQAVASVRGEKQWFQTVAHYDDSFEIAGYDEETGDAHKRGAWTDGAVASWAYEEIREISPTHWRPLPSAPASEGAE
nr:DUF551 domain-containing protein [Brucella intermedia]